MRTIYKIIKNINNTKASALWTVPKGFERGLEELENPKTNRNNSKYCITEISQNTEKSSGDLRRFAVT